MPRYNILVGCDQKYYDDWARNLLISIRHYAPWVKLHAHVVNPTHIDPVDGVEFTTEHKDFINETQRIGYLQAVRFLKVAEKFNDKDLVMTLDVDTICTRKFTKQEFEQATNRITCLRHLKDKRWLAGLVTYGMSGFKKDFAKRLLAKPFEQWAPFHDQNVLFELSKDYQFFEQPSKLFWMSIGKNGNQSVFLTLKGNQKNKDKYLDTFRKFIR